MPVIQQGVFWPQVNSGKVNYSHNLAAPSLEIFLDRVCFSAKRMRRWELQETKLRSNLLRLGYFNPPPSIPHTAYKLVKPGNLTQENQASGGN